MLNFGFQSHKQNLSRFRIPDYIKVRYNGQEKRAARFVLPQNELNRAFSLTWPASMQIYWNKRNRSQVLITSPPSLVKGSGKQYSSQRRVYPSYDQYRGKEWWVSRRNLNSVYELYGNNWHALDVLATRFTPSLRPEGQAGESAAMWVIFSNLQEQWHQASL